MSVFSKTLLTLVRGHLMLLSFLSAWHSNALNGAIISNPSDKNLPSLVRLDPCPFLLRVQIVFSPAGCLQYSSTQCQAVIDLVCDWDLPSTALPAAPRLSRAVRIEWKASPYYRGLTHS